MNTLYEFAKEILQDIDTWKNCVALGETAGDRWHLERLFIKSPYQIERVTIAPHTGVTNHFHPNVDTCEIYIPGAEFQIMVNYHNFKVGPHLKPHRRIIAIPHGVEHSGWFPFGGQFLSVQHWLDRNPRHISEDWDSPVFAEKTIPLDRT